MPTPEAKLQRHALLNPDADSNAIHMRRVQPNVFGIAVNWFFNQELQCLIPHGLEFGQRSTNQFAFWVSLYVFAVGYEIKDLAAEIIRQLRELLENTPWDPTPIEIQDYTTVSEEIIH